VSDSLYGFVVPRWGVMWAIAVSIYGASKGISWFRRKPSAAPVWKHVTYLVGWPGMDVDAFLDVRPASRPTVIDWGFAFFKFACGLGVLLFIVPALGGANEYIVGWVGMLGIVFILHFGLFHILSCACRQLGLNAVPIMNWPIASQSLTEFWGKRWNLAFRDLTYQLLFRPLARFMGPAGALMAGFMLSGLVHDVVISIPSGGGYGLPTCYFSIQGTAILAERSRWGRAIGLGHGLRGWLFCLVVLVAPCALLFHQPFVCRVIIPFLQAAGVVR
jgi:membrane bound O-acyltransferase family protein